MRTRVTYMALALAACGAALASAVQPAGAQFPGRNGLIAYSVSSGPQRERIWVTRPNGSKNRRLPNGKAGSEPSFSPNGRRIVFVSHRHSGYHGTPLSEIFIIDANGLHERQLTHVSGANSPFTCCTVYDSPSFSPDGKQIVYTASGAIYVMNADGSAQHLLYRDNGDDSNPAYSPDGKLITFASNDTQITTPGIGGGKASEIFVINADGSGKRQLTSDTGGDSAPSFSPSGGQIVSSRKTGPDPSSIESEIFTMNADGSNQRQLTTTGANVANGAPSFSPDGREIVFMHQRGANYPQILTMRTDGSHVRTITHGTPGHTDPSWQRR